MFKYCATDCLYLKPLEQNAFVKSDCYPFTISDMM